MRRIHIDVLSPRQLIFGLSLVALFALVIAGFVTRDVLSGKRDEAALQKDAAVVTAAVSEVTSRSRTGDPLEIEVRLPDGRMTHVDVSARPSNSSLQIGSRIEILVQRSDISNNRPTDIPPAEFQVIPNVAPLVGIAMACLVVCGVVRFSRSVRRGV